MEFERCKTTKDQRNLDFYLNNLYQSVRKAWDKLVDAASKLRLTLHDVRWFERLNVEKELKL